MTPNPNDYVDYRTRKKLDTCVSRAVASMEHENTLMAETPIGILHRLLKVYKILKPLFVFLTTFPLVPQSVRTGIGIFIQLLESAANAEPEITAYFKAGRDLEAAT